MKALLDTNIVIDWLAKREPFFEQSVKILKFLTEKENMAYLTASSITDVFYLLNRNHSGEYARQGLERVFMVFNIIDVTAGDCKQASKVEMKDYEDALISVCASKEGVDCIITRDELFLKSAAVVKMISPADFMKEFLID